MGNCNICGSAFVVGSKFCKKCGNRLIDNQVLRNTDNGETSSREIYVKQSSEIKSNNNSDESPSSIDGFASWLKQTLINPSNDKSVPFAYGMTCFLMHSMLVAFSIYQIQNVVSKALNEFIRFSNSEEARKMDEFATGSQLYLHLFLYIVGVYFFFIVIGFLSKKYLLKSNVLIKDFVNKLASRSNGILLIELVLSVLTIIYTPTNVASKHEIQSLENVLGLLLMIFIITFSFWIVSLVSTLNSEISENKTEKIYMISSTIAISNIVVIWFFGTSIANKLIDGYQTLL